MSITSSLPRSGHQPRVRPLIALPLATAALCVAGQLVPTAALAAPTSYGFDTMSLSAGTSRSQFLTQISSSSTEVAASLSVDKTPGGSGLYISVVGRRVDSAGQYAAKIRYLPDGRVSLSLGRADQLWHETALAAEMIEPFQVSPGEWLSTRVRTTGTSPTTVQAKVWKTGTNEPTGYQLQATDATAGLQAAGAPGVNGYLSTSATNAPVATRFSDVLVDPAVGGPTEPPPPPPPGPTGTRATGSAGSLPVGSAAYPVPAGAVFVSPAGDDAAAGSQAAPWRTLGRAVAVAPNGSTVVLRAGSYHETVSIPSGRRLTVQAYPGEPVWFDGSRSVTNWVSDGAAWRADGWTTVFDHSPTFTKGAPDGAPPYGAFVNPAHPMAAYPDQVYVDGVAQTQVGSRGEVTAGTFFVDTSTSRLYLGTSPSGRQVRSSDLSSAISVRGAGSVLRGFGVRRYATSVPQLGTVLAVARDVVLENLVVSDNATQGIFAGGRDAGTNVVLKHVTTERNGLTGIGSNYADGLQLLSVRASSNNSQHFNLAPVSGGVKITRSRGITVSDSVFGANEGPGLWLDESVYDVKVTGNDLVGNVGHGVSFEISSKGVFADNLVAGNGADGMKMNNASELSIWNNTFVDNRSYPLVLVQDSRVASNLSTSGHDPRQALPDPTVTWLLGPATVKNNIFARTSAYCFLCVLDSTLRRGAATIGVRSDGNVYNRPSTSNPSWLVTWANGGANAEVYSTVAAFRAATGQEAHGVEFTGSSVLDGNNRPTSSLLSIEGATAQPLDAAVAGLVEHATGERHLGAWLY